MVSNANLTSAQLTSMRNSFATTLADRCTVLRNTPSDNGAGGQTANWVAVHTEVPIGFGPFRVPFLKEIEVLETRVDSRSRWEAAFPYGSDVLIKDRIVVDGGFTYEVAAHRSPQTFGLYVYYLLILVD